MAPPIIVLEGIDGAGTTTQAKLLCDYLEKKGLTCHQTKQPSDGFIGKLLRNVLSKTETTNDETVALLYAADRTDHLTREVRPAQKRGEIVVSDRWYHSSFAYQGTIEYQKVTDPMSWIREINRCAQTPDLTFFVDVSVKVAAERRRTAGRDHELFDDDEIQERVRAGYKRVLETLAGTENVVIIDGERSTEMVSKDIIAGVEKLLKKVG